MNVTNPTTPNTPAAGGRFTGMRRQVVRTVMGKVFCDECGNPFTEDQCPHCAQRRRHRAGLEVGVETYGGHSVWETVERADGDDVDGSSWDERRSAGDDGPEGWPW